MVLVTMVTSCFRPRTRNYTICASTIAYLLFVLSWIRIEISRGISPVTLPEATLIPQDVEVSSSNSSSLQRSLMKEPINAIDQTSTEISNSTNKTNETVCLDQTPIEFLKMNRFSPFFPSELRAVMQSECKSELCFLLAREEANITQKIDELGTSRLAVLSQKWRDWNQAEHGVLNFSNVAINSIGDLSLCRVTTGLRVVGSWGCSENPPKAGNCTVHGPTYAKVIVISQCWGDNYFHGVVEGLPRLAAALDSLPPSESAREWQVHSIRCRSPRSWPPSWESAASSAVISLRTMSWSPPPRLAVVIYPGQYLPACAPASTRACRTCAGRRTTACWCCSGGRASGVWPTTARWCAQRGGCGRAAQ